MATLSRQLARILLFLLLATAFVALAPPNATAAPYAAHVMDARTGETLYSKNAETRLHPASLTKMLTLYIAFDAIQRGEISLDTMVTVSKNAASQPPSRLGLRAGQRIALRYLIRAAAVKSANDAASAIGDALSGSESRFAARMNRTAKALGMKNSTFKNANGLTVAGHLSTARDMSVLGRRLFYDFPQYYNIFSRRSADAGMAEVANTNRRFLDAYKGADGIKTGYTVAAGFNLTASAERGSKRIIATVFGGTSTAQRNAKMAELLDIGFGEAPARAAVRKPAPANLPPEEPVPETGETEAAPDLVAEAVAAEAGGSGKTIRLAMGMKTSPRPRSRPAAAVPTPEIVPAVAVAAATDAPSEAVAAAEMVGALQDSIEDAVAAAAIGEPAPAFAMAGADEAEAPGLTVPSDVPGTVDPVPDQTAAAAAPDQPERLVRQQAAASDEPLPFTVVDANGVPVSPGALPLDGTLPPDGALPFAMVDPADLPRVAAQQATAGLQLASAAAAPMPVLLPLPTAAAATAEPEVISRLSTSGGRGWGVNLGRLPSRGAAERILTKTSLAEGGALGEGLRKIVSRGGGYDANVLGLTEAQAGLACRRLQARAQECQIIGP